MNLIKNPAPEGERVLTSNLYPCTVTHMHAHRHTCMHTLTHTHKLTEKKMYEEVFHELVFVLTFENLSIYLVGEQKLYSD